MITEVYTPHSCRFVNKEWLENKIGEINAEIYKSTAKEAARLEAARTFYVRKLLEMDELDLRFIEL